nr:PREDICTED: M-phase inducer phosphatase 1-like [Latimeria chalumnae]|eukprot:XP_014343172.1 PREDICTED: M-phase inducer phosphatase 1-like [Latimeria chalumnae]
MGYWTEKVRKSRLKMNMEKDEVDVWVASLLRGKYNHAIENYVIADCRYPYEYEGGHIKAAINIYREDQVVSDLLENSPHPSSTGKRTIVIFHCEFSSERAPKLCRYLRKLDRNANVYPRLFYPEMYILKGGYREFFGEFKLIGY